MKSNKIKKDKRTRYETDIFFWKIDARYIKQGYTLKNSMEGLSDKVYCPWESPKKSILINQHYICQRTKESFNSLIKGNLGVFQNHRKQAKNNVVFHHFPSSGLNETP